MPADYPHLLTALDGRPSAAIAILRAGFSHCAGITLRQVLLGTSAPFVDLGQSVRFVGLSYDERGDPCSSATVSRNDPRCGQLFATRHGSVSIH